MAESGEQLPQAPRKRRRKWDVQAPAAAPVSVLAAAQSAVARVLPAQQQPQQQQAPPPQLPAAQPAAQPAAVVRQPEATVDLCSCSGNARRRLVARATHSEITAKTGAAVTTRGRYIPPAEAAQAGPEALHLHLTADTQDQVDAAVAMAQAIVRDSAAPEQGPAGRGQSVPPWGAASAVFSHYLAVGIEPAAARGFDVCAKVSGPGGQFLAHVGREAKCVVSLRGGSLPHEPLGVFIDQAPSQEALRHAVGLVSWLLLLAAAGCCWLLLLAGDTQFAHSLARSLAMVHMPMLMSMPMPMPLPLTICCHMQRHSVNRCLLLYEQSFRAGCTCRLMHHHRWNIQCRRPRFPALPPPRLRRLRLLRPTLGHPMRHSRRRPDSQPQPLWWLLLVRALLRSG
jgi:hypothetical protein